MPKWKTWEVCKGGVNGLRGIYTKENIHRTGLEALTPTGTCNLHSMPALHKAHCKVMRGKEQFD